MTDNKRKMHAVYNPPRADDINYPGAGGDMQQRQTSRATVTYDTYVLDYAARQRSNVLMSAAGITAGVGAAFYLSGELMVFVIAAAVGLTVAGLAGFVVCADAHASYTRDLAVAVSETWNVRPAARPAESARAFVPSTNPHTIRASRLTFAPVVWEGLLDAAESNGALTRDLAKGAGVGRRWYNTDPNAADGWRALRDELQRLGFIDDQNRPTPQWGTWYDAQFPALPRNRSAQNRTHDRPTGDRPAVTGGEWGE